MKPKSISRARSLVPALAAAALLLARPTSAIAQDASHVDEVPREAQEETRWYGWQTLIVDAAATGLLTAGLIQTATSESRNTTLLLSGYGVYVFGPPIVHFAHRKVGIGFADMGIRIAAPVVLALAGNALAGRGGSSGELFASGEGTAAGFLVGYAGAVALDAALFARERVKRNAHAAWYTPQVVPIRDVDGRAKPTGAGIGGQF